MSVKNKIIDLSEYELIIFDFDGVIADSLGAYRELDRLMIEDLYGIDEDIREIEQMSERIRTGAINNSEVDYYRSVDQKYGDGKRSIDEIWDKIHELAPIVQANILPKPGVIDVLNEVKCHTACPIVLATGSSRCDVDFFSSEKSRIGRQLNLNDYFDAIITIEDVEKPKPNPESFLKLIERYDVAPETVLVFEDSYSGVSAGKAIGATVIAIEDVHNRRNKNAIMDAADLYLEDWSQILLQ